MNQNILVINTGSSSIKFSLISPEGHTVVVAGLAEKLGVEGSNLQIKSKGFQQDLQKGGHREAIKAILDWLSAQNLLKTIAAVGHRVVHGAEAFKDSTLINAEVLATIERCVAYAPLHNPANLLGIGAAMEALPDLPHVGVFDTAFHQSLPEYAYRYAVPESWYRDHGVRRYGFHGTSHQYVSMEAARVLNLPLENSAFITAHLGNGSSAAAILNGHSVDTTMGFTPLEGLVMGTRSGDIDPGLPPYIAKSLGISVSEVVDLLNKKSGLLGLSGVSGDVRELQEAANNGHSGAIIALEVFCFRIAKYIGGLMTSLPRLDALIFTGGIGENSAFVRSKVLSRLAIFGFSVDKEANEKTYGGKQGLITVQHSQKALVISTNEELMIALDTSRVVDIENRVM